MFAYYLRLATKSALSTPGPTLLTIAAIALGVAVPTALLSVRQVMAQDPIPGKSDRLYNVRVDNWELGNEFFGVAAGEPPKHIAYRDMRGLMASDLPRFRTGIATARAFVFPESETIRPYPALIRLCHADFFPMFEAPFRYGGGWNRAADDDQGIEPVPPPATTDCDVGASENVQPTPACVTVKVWPATVSVPTRCTELAFAATL